MKKIHFFQDIDIAKANQLASIIRYMVAILISILLVRSYLMRAQVGALEYFFLLTNTATFFILFAFSSAILSSFNLTKAFSPSTKWGHIVVMLTGFGVLVGGLAFLYVFFCANGLKDIELWIVPVHCFFLITGIIPEAFCVLNGMGKRLFKFTTVTNLLFLGLITVCLLLQASIFILALCYTALQVVRTIIGISWTKPKLNFSLKAYKYWLGILFPLMGYFILGSGMDYMDGNLVEYFFSKEEFLYYRYGARELPITFLILNALGATYIPILSKEINKLEELRYRLNKLLPYLSLISVVFIFISPLLFQWVYGKDFIESSMIFNVYILIFSSRILMPHLVLYAKQKNTVLMYISAIECICNAILSILLLKWIGLIGVPIATVIAYLVNRVIAISYTKKKWGIGLSNYIDSKQYIVFNTAILVGFIISFYINFNEYI